MPDRSLTLEVARVTEAAAIAAARMRGLGDEHRAHEAAVQTMARAFDLLHIDGHVVVGEGEEGQVSALWLDQALGQGGAPVDIACTAIEGLTRVAKDLPEALSVAALAERDALLRVPRVYMEKIAVGPGLPDGVVDLDSPVAENLARLAEAKGVGIADLTVCVLDRPRHAGLIGEIRAAGARLRLISDGDIAGIIHTTNPAETGIDIYMGSGGAPQGVLAAAALACTGGQMQARLLARSDDHVRAIRRAGISDAEMRRKLTLADMVRGDVIFAASGITGGSLLSRVHFSNGVVRTHTLSMRASTGTVRESRVLRRLDDTSDLLHGIFN